jgi:hypothetical protein
MWPGLDQGICRDFGIGSISEFQKNKIVGKEACNVEFRMQEL